jgi:hypothetical protein
MLIRMYNKKIRLLTTNIGHLADSSKSENYSNK